MEAPVLPPYLSSLLPPPEELFAVQVKHIVSPDEVRARPAVASGSGSGAVRVSAVGLGGLCLACSVRSYFRTLVFLKHLLIFQSCAPYLHIYLECVDFYKYKYIRGF
jgi:hypothetical protein